MLVFGQLLAFLLASPSLASEYNPGAYLPSAAPEPKGTGELGASVMYLQFEGSGAPLAFVRGGYALSDRGRMGGSLGLGPSLSAPPNIYWTTVTGQYALVRQPAFNLAAYLGVGYLLVPSFCFFDCSTLNDVFGLVGVAAEGGIGPNRRVRIDVSVPVVLSYVFGSASTPALPTLGAVVENTLRLTEAGVSVPLGPTDTLRLGKSYGLSAEARWTHRFGNANPAWFTEIAVAGPWLTHWPEFGMVGQVQIGRTL